MSRRGRSIIVAVSLTATALFLLPVLLMFGPVFSLLQQELARHIPGELEIASCSLGWLNGLRCEQVRYLDPVRGLQCETPWLATDKGLLALIAAPSYLGEITIDQPTCTFRPPQPEDTRGRSATDGLTDKAASLDSPTRNPPWWERLALRLKISHGQALFELDAEPARLLARQIDFAGSLVLGTISYELSFRSPQQDGHLKAKGVMHLPQAGQSTLETLVSQANIEITHLELSDFLAWAASRNTLPRGKGVLDAVIRVNAAGMTEIETQGETVVHGLQLTGGVLGEDQPQLDHLRFAFKGSRRQAEGWRLAALTLQSDPIRLHANGAVDGQAVSLAVQGQINMPALAAQLPHLLRIHERTNIVEGTTGFSLTATGRPDALTIRADCRTDRLRFVHNQQSYSWTTPLTLEVEAVHGQEDSGLRTLHLHAPFFEANGNSGADGFALRGGGDLDRMSQELGKLLAMDIRAKGRVEITATSSKNGDGDLRLESRMAIRDFSLARGKQTLVPTHPLLLTGTITGPTSFFNTGIFHTVSLEGAAWPGTLSFRASDLQRRAVQEDNNVTLQGTVDLGRLNDIVHGFADIGHLPALRGGMQFEAAGEWLGSAITVRQLQGTVDRLAVMGERFSLQEPRVMFGLGGIGGGAARQVAVQGLMVVEDWQDFTAKANPLFYVDVDQRRVEVRRLAWASTKTALEVDSLIEDWQQAATDSSFALRGETDGALLSNLATAAGLLPSDLTVKGRVRGNWSFDATRSQEREQAFSLEVTSFELARGKKIVASDPLLACNLRMQGSVKQPEEQKITDFRLRTVPISVAGSGLIKRKDSPELELQGHLTPQYARLVPLLQPYIGRETSIGGSQPGGFHLFLPLVLPLQWERITLIAELPVDILGFRGINLGAMTLPLEFHRNKLRLRIDGQLDGGRVALAPLWDLSLPQPLLTLPANAPCLINVPLKTPLLDGILGRLHPLFGGLSQPQGAIDLRISNFSLPITAKGGQWPAFTASIAVDRLQFKPTEPLQELFNLNGYDQEWYRCKEKEIQCEGKNGRVRCEQIHLLAGEDTVAFKGEISQDRQLQYTVQFPLGRQLAETVQLNTEDEVLVVAAIDGTRLEPAFDSDAFITSLPAQLRRGEKLTEPNAANHGGPSASP